MSLEIVERPSPNFNDRKIAGGPRFLIVHYTDMVTAEAAMERMCDPASEVSAHYVVEEHGIVHRLVAEDKRAWHAGVSAWEGEHNINAHSIGIELVNPGHSHGYRKFPALQMRALIALCRNIFMRYPIHPSRVLAHSDVAPARKQDPGILFDWPMLAGAGIGLWPAPDEADYELAAEMNGNPAHIQMQLETYGYAPENALDITIGAFQRHFHPDVFRDPDMVGQADGETLARLSSLLRLKRG